MVTSIISGRLMVFKKTVWVGIRPKHEKCCGLSPEILHDVTVVVVLDDIFDPLVAVQVTSTLRFWLMTRSSLGSADLGEILFTFQNIDEFPEVWVICKLHYYVICDIT